MFLLQHFFTITRMWKQPGCPITNEWIQKLWYIYTMEHYSAFQTTFKEKSRALELSVLFSSLVANSCCGFAWVADSMCHYWQVALPIAVRQARIYSKVTLELRVATPKYATIYWKFCIEIAWEVVIAIRQHWTFSVSLKSRKEISCEICAPWI